MPERRLSLIEAHPTVCFIHGPDGLLHGYDIRIDNAGAAFAAEPSVRFAGTVFSCPGVEIAGGESTFRIFIPDLREPTSLVFEMAGAELTVEHTPRRHWTVHVVQFAHHDLGYTDIPSNVLREMAGYLDDALRFCTETDHFPPDSQFRYTIEQGWSLLYWLRHRPEAARLAMMRRIREGRMEVNAFFGNQITELQGPEEMVRMLYPVFALNRDYGIPVECAEHNDIPGISWGVASVLAGAGIRYFSPALPDYFRWGPQYRTFWDEEIVVPGNRPHAFWWEAPTGERVLFWYHRQGAGGPIDVRLPELEGYLQKLEGTEYPYDVLRYQVRGGDRDNSNTRKGFAETCRAWNERYAFPKLIPSLNRAFFPELEKQLAADLPVFRGELPATDYSAAANCTAYPSSINRVTHDQLLIAERLAALAHSAAGSEYPADTLVEAYESLLKNDEHCWGLAHPTGPGQDACLAQHNENAFRAAALTHDVLVKSSYALDDHIEVKDKGYHAVVFNPLNWTRTGVAVAPASPADPCSMILAPAPDGPQDPDDPYALFYHYPVKAHGQPRIPSELLRKGFRVVDVQTGEAVPHQVYELEDAHTPAPYAGYRYNMGAHDPDSRVDVRFLCCDVPALGCRVYRFEPLSTLPARECGVTVTDCALESPFYRVELDRATGTVASILDKELGRELVDAEAEYHLNQVVLRSSLTSERCTSLRADICKGNCGPISGSLTVHTSAPGFPLITQEITLYAHSRRIDLATSALKDSSGHLETFIAFPFALKRPRFRYEGSLSVIEPFKDQFPGSNTDYYAVQHWAAATDGGCSVLLSSMDAPMMQFGDNWPLYISQAHHGFTPPNFDHAFHGPEAVTKGHLYSFVLLNNYRTNFSPSQSGEFLFRYSLTSHAGDIDVSAAREFGYGASLPLVHSAIDGPQTGSLSIDEPWVEVDAQSLLLLAFKRAEDGRGYVLRFLETEGRDTRAAVRVPSIDIASACLTNLVEEDVGPVDVRGQAVTFDVRAWGTATLRLLPRD